VNDKGYARSTERYRIGSLDRKENDLKRKVTFEESLTLKAAVRIAKACAMNVINDKGHVAFEVVLNSRKEIIVQPLGYHKHFASHKFLQAVPVPLALAPVQKIRRRRSKLRIAA
jgi:hypothetical protein